MSTLTGSKTFLAPVRYPVDVEDLKKLLEMIESAIASYIDTFKIRNNILRRIKGDAMHTATICHAYPIYYVSKTWVIGDEVKQQDMSFIEAEIDYLLYEYQGEEES